MPDVSQLRILIVDDHFLARQVATDVMHEMNVAHVTAVVDGAAARDALNAALDNNEPFDVLFLDWDMPHLDGLEVLQQFRRRREFNATAFIMYTSVSRQADVLKAVRAGATGYLIKPVTKQAIGKKLLDAASWLEKQKQA